MVMRELYRNADNAPQSSFVFDNAALAASLERIYRQEFDPKTEIDKDLFNAIWETLNDGIERGFTSVAGDRHQDFLRELKTNNAVFSAFKTHRMQNDIAGQLLDENGELKSFARFKADTAAMVDHQVGRWLKIEHDTAIIRAHGAADWQQFERERDILPNLRWNESLSVDPRESHRVFWGRIWPMDDPHWAKHRPGDLWGCKCSLSSTDEPPTDNSDLNRLLTSHAAAAPGLGGNPAVTGKIFSNDHPYVANARKGAKKAVEDLLHRLNLAAEKVSEKRFKSGGVLQTPAAFRQNAIEQAKNVRAYTELAKMHGERYKLLSIDNVSGKKNPDALNLKTGYHSDMKNPVTLNGKSAIQAAIKSAAKQRVEELYIYLTRDYGTHEIYRGLAAGLQAGRGQSLRTIIIRFKDGSLRRYDPSRLREWLKK